MPVSTSRGATVGDPGLPVPNVWPMELPGIRLSAPGEERPGRRFFCWLGGGFVFFSWTCTSEYWG